MVDMSKTRRRVTNPTQMTAMDKEAVVAVTCLTYASAEPQTKYKIGLKVGEIKTRAIYDNDEIIQERKGVNIHTDELEEILGRFVVELDYLQHDVEEQPGRQHDKNMYKVKDGKQEAFRSYIQELYLENDHFKRESKLVLQ